MTGTIQPQALNSFLRAVKSCRPTTYQSIKTPPSPRFNFHTSSRKLQTTYPNRYGPAATESLPPPPKPAGSLTPKKGDPKADETQQSQSQAKQTSESPPPQSSSESAPVKVKNNQDQQELNKGDTEREEQKVNQEENLTPLEQATEAAVQAKQAQAQNGKDLPPEEDPNQPLGNKELDEVLSIPAPSESNQGRPRHPHLEPSPYEHHFDTYSLVQQLAKDGDNTFTEQQAITVMKAVRQMLSINLEIAKEGLISKSDVENESYLFRAACSELRTTLQTARAGENQRQRTQRALLQHEMDILNQKFTQNMQNMREDLKGMFNDRKMGLQEEGRKTDSQISELNYKITVMLNSDSKSEVEGLRWVLTRRAALAIGTAAFMTLSALQYYSVKSKEYAEVEKKRAASKKAQEERIANESQYRATTPGRTEYEESLG